MTPETLTPPILSDLVALRLIIHERTWGRVAGLTVAVEEGRVRVRGRTGSFYLKQRAVQACVETLPPEELRRLHVEIAVAGE